MTRGRLRALWLALVVLGTASPGLAHGPRDAAPPKDEARRGAQHRPQHGRTSRTRRVRRPAVTSAYRRQRERWHRRPSRAQVRAWAGRQPPPLVLRPLGVAGTFELTPDAGGRFTADQIERARQAFAYRRDGSMHEIHPRLLEVIYRAVKRFQAPYVTLVSGYRDTRATSRHAQGRAADMVLPGVSDQRLAAFARQQGYVGVGIYPVSGFVHVDVRSRSYFWVDYSGPGQPQRNRQILRTAAIRADAQARRRGEVSVPDVQVAAGGPAAEGEGGDAPAVPGATAP